MKKSETATSNPKCLNPDCEKPAETRGLCGSDYGMLLQLIKEEKLSWEQAEAKGKCLPKQKRTSRKMEWFLT